MELGTTTTYRLQFKGRAGWLDWSDGPVKLDHAKREVERLVSEGEDPAKWRVVQIVTTITEYCW